MSFFSPRRHGGCTEDAQSKVSHRCKDEMDRFKLMYFSHKSNLDKSTKHNAICTLNFICASVAKKQILSVLVSLVFYLK
jgi:hypothetical protein